MHVQHVGTYVASSRRSPIDRAPAAAWRCRVFVCGVWCVARTCEPAIICLYLPSSEREGTVVRRFIQPFYINYCTTSTNAQLHERVFIHSGRDPPRTPPKSLNGPSQQLCRRSGKRWWRVGRFGREVASPDEAGDAVSATPPGMYRPWGLGPHTR